MGNLFQQLLNKVSRGYGQADKNLFGGLLPGGAARQKPEQSKWKQDVGATNTTQGKPWAGKPGQFRSSWQPLNAIDAITKAGANPLGLAQANPNDIKLVSNYYSANPQVANQYDLRTNLFLRYMAGIGTKDLELSPETGREIYQATSKSHDPIRGMKNWQDGPAMERLYADYGLDNGALQRLGKGHVPVRYKNDFGNMDYFRTETAFGLGQFWAEPQSDNSYIVSDKYDFFYAPKSKGGTDDATNKRLQEATKNKTILNPVQAATKLLTMGVGTPYPIRMQVYPDGRVEPINTP